MKRAKGFIVLNREILDWEWYDDIKTKVLFLHLLLTANHKEQKWQGKVINKGELITSIAHLSAETGLSQREVRTALNHLKSTGEVTDKIYSKFRIITVKSYDSFQSSDRQNDSQATGKRQANDRQATADIRSIRSIRNKEDKKSAGAYDPLAGRRKRYDDL